MSFSIMSTITKQRERRPPRVILYGPEGIGKSTFAANGPNPIFIQTEDGLGEIEVSKFPLAKSWAEVRDQLTALQDETHDYEMVVIDTLDWLEKLIWEQVALDHKKKSIDDIPFYKGYLAATNYWKEVTEALDDLRQRKQMACCLLAHSKVERFEDPQSAAYDRYVPRLNKHASDHVREWSDAILFADIRKRIQTEDQGFGKTRAIAHSIGDERIIRAVGSPTCVAKNRYGITGEIPLSWSAFVSAMD